MRTPLTSIAPLLIDRFTEINFTPVGLSEFLGTEAVAAFYRGEPGAVLHALTGKETAPLAAVIRAFMLHQGVSYAQLGASLGANLLDGCLRCGLIGTTGSVAGEIGQQITSPTDVAASTLLQALLDVRPVEIAGVVRFVFSDIDASMVAGHVPGHDHVLGLGAASLSLLNSTPRTNVGSVLDLGTGCGVQLLGQVGCGDQLLGTDIHPRALDLAEATLAGAGLTAELREGSWFDPVEQLQFDRIVANPPFVVGPPVIEHIYRDSGLDLDGATSLVVQQACEHLALGGMAHILGSWVHTPERMWQQRVASWLPDTGFEAWFLQRDIVTPSHYVGTWVRDESLDPRSATGQLRTQQWLDHFAASGVSGIGFGFIAIRRLADGEPSHVVAEEFSHSFDDELGPEIAEYFQRTEWLRHHSAAEILDSRFGLRPDLAKEQISLVDSGTGMGFVEVVLRLSRTDGPRFQHEIDGHIASLLAGLDPAGLSLANVIELYAAVHGFDELEIREAVISIIVDLVRHGMILPSEFFDQQDTTQLKH